MNLFIPVILQLLDRRNMEEIEEDTVTKFPNCVCMGDAVPTSKSGKSNNRHCQSFVSAAEFSEFSRCPCVYAGSQPTAEFDADQDTASGGVDASIGRRRSLGLRRTQPGVFLLLE